MNQVSKMLQQEIQRVLMEQALDTTQFARLKQMIRGAEEFLIGMQPTYVKASAPAPVHEKLFLPVGLVKRAIEVLLDADSDVANELVELANACGVKTYTPYDTIMPIEFGLVHHVAVALDEDEIRERFPEAVYVANDLAKAISENTGRVHAEMVELVSKAEPEAEA